MKILPWLVMALLPFAGMTFAATQPIDADDYRRQGDAWFLGTDGRSVDRAKARGYWERACEAGSAAGCMRLGSIHFHGKGVPKHVGKALVFYEKACRLGWPDACSQAGVQYQDGLGVKKDDEKANQLFQTACEAGSVAGCTNWSVSVFFASKTQEDYGRALTIIDRLCARNCPTCCFRAGIIYRLGLSGRKDPTLALDRYEQGCRLKEGTACAEAASLYLERNEPAVAAKRYEKACALESSLGCIQLARMYFNGLGVEQNKDKALELLDTRCGKNDAEACAYQAYLLMKESKSPADKERCLALFEKSCAMGFKPACEIVKAPAEPL